MPFLILRKVGRSWVQPFLGWGRFYVPASWRVWLASLLINGIIQKGIQEYHFDYDSL
jgi:hypothetical protein